MLRRNSMCLSLSVILMIAFSASSVWGAENQARPRPIKGTAQGVVVSTIPPNGIVISATGTATHLGRYTRLETLFLNPDGSFQGFIVFESANGDLLNCDVVGQFVSPTDAIGTYNFTGGTGRFAGASGQADFQAFTPDGVHLSVSFRGKISY